MIKMRLISGLFPLLCTLLMVHVCSGNSGDKTVVVFQSTKTEISKNGDNGEKTEQKLTDISVPAFVGGVLNNTEFLAVICGASTRTTSSEGTNHGVVRTSFANHNQWSTAKVFTNDTQTSTKYTLGKEITAVMNKNKIYVLAKGFYKGDNPQNKGRFNDGWEPLMFVGTVTVATDSDGNGASITWKEEKSIKDLVSDTSTETQGISFQGGVGNGIVTKRGAIVFPIQMGKQYSKATSSIMYSTDNGSTWTIGGITEYNTDKGSVVEWGDGKLLLIVSSDGGFRKAFESTDMGHTWNESLVFSRVWGNKIIRKFDGKQGSAIKVSMDSGEVLLFAHPLTAKGGSSAETLQLWLSDGQRIVRIGTISDSEKELNTGNSILAHMGDHLYITHEINSYEYASYSGKFQDWSAVIGFTPLPDFFESAKKTVHKWRGLDTSYQSMGINTSSLVGVLGNTKNDEVWADMYNCVNATVKGAASVEDGFCFDGKPGSGAQWPVSSQGQNQVYIFTETQFTLAATVIIHTGNEEGKFPLIGASLDSLGNHVLLGLGYTHDNKWYVVSDNNKQQSTTTQMFKREREYHVALTFAKGKASVYVDGVSITDKEMTISSEAIIHHFYMGGTEQSSTEKGSSCTVKNVMLFNKPLLQNETAKLAQVCKKSNLEEEETSTALPELITEDRTSVLATNSANIPDKSKSVSKHETKESPVISIERVINDKANGTQMHKFQNKLANGVFEKNIKEHIDSAMSLSAVSWMFFLCSFIVVAQF